MLSGSCHRVLEVDLPNILEASWLLDAEGGGGRGGGGNTVWGFLGDFAALDFAILPMIN